MKNETFWKPGWTVEPAGNGTFLVRGPRGGLHGLLPTDEAGKFRAVAFNGAGSPDFTRSTDLTCCNFFLAADGWKAQTR